jgi:hypothetical protein
MLFAFAPLHKRAFGVAMGVAGATMMAAFTIAAILIPGAHEFPLFLVGQYFQGFTVTWPGVFIGAGWAFAVAFVAGWFAAFCRNLALAMTVFVIKSKAEIESTREFLDHI